MPENYYERLGVSRDASDSTVKSAFRERIKETHPDVSDDEAASDRTKRLIEAKDVLTDDEERAKYDRLGHEAYLSHSGTTTATEAHDDATQSQEDTTTTDASTTSGNNSATGARTTSHQSGSTDSRRTTQQSDSTGASEHAGQSANWYDTSRQQQSNRATTDRHHVWDTEQSYAVGDSPGMFSLRELVTSQRAIVLLGTTFVIYPVLLFGALFQSFPTAANLIVAMCIILVVAFLQSVPQVGMVVFGVWLVLLPVILFGVVGVPVLSITGVLSIAAVAFPFGLSVLTWIAIGPSRRQF